MSSFRLQKLESTVRHIVSDVIRFKLNDPRVAPLSSVTRVELSGDLQVAKVFISVFGSEAEGRRTLAALRHARGHIQRFVAQSLRTRHCPELRLEYDDTVRRTAETMQIIDDTMKEHRHPAPPDAPADPVDQAEDESEA